MFDSTKGLGGPVGSQLGRIGAQTLGLGSFVPGMFSARHDVTYFGGGSRWTLGPGGSPLGRIGAQILGLGSFVLGRFPARHDIIVHTDYLKLSSALILF